jgi:pyruvate formate lyase activating enzyme
MPFALRASRLALACSPRRPLRICFETNGTVHPGLLQQAVRLALDTGGIVKFDLKAWDRTLHRALTGVDNQRVLENFRLAAGHISQRPEVPLVVASTLMVPGYVEAQEVEAIASFIASVEPEIPYALLAFSPQFMMQELPLLSRREAQECLQAARRAGLRNVRLGNVHLLR